jgi:hypothetical protein
MEGIASGHTGIPLGFIPSSPQSLVESLRFLNLHAALVISHPMGGQFDRDSRRLL